MFQSVLNLSISMKKIAGKMSHLKTLKSMKLSNIFLSILSIFLFSCDPVAKYNASLTLDADTMDQALEIIIKYAAPLPKKATYETRFKEDFNEYYQDQKSKHSFDYYYFDQNTKRYYFSISRVAPSLYEKKVAVSGYYILSDSGELSDYEEVYRTWKMSPDELLKKNSKLFLTLVKGGDLSPYYIENNDEEWIEFPDAKVAYDKVNRKWELRSFIDGQTREAGTLIRP
jgi:hypothetical protein